MFLWADFAGVGSIGYALLQTHLHNRFPKSIGVKLVPPRGMVNESKSGTGSGASEARSGLSSCLMR